MYCKEVVNFLRQNKEFSQTFIGCFCSSVITTRGVILYVQCTRFTHCVRVKRKKSYKGAQWSDFNAAYMYSYKSTLFFFSFFTVKGCYFCPVQWTSFFILNKIGLLEALISSGKIILEYYLSHKHFYTHLRFFKHYTVLGLWREVHVFDTFHLWGENKGLRKTVLATIFLCEKLSPKSKREREQQKPIV